MNSNPSRLQACATRARHAVSMQRCCGVRGTSGAGLLELCGEWEAAQITTLFHALEVPWIEERTHGAAHEPVLPAGRYVLRRRALGRRVRVPEARHRESRHIVHVVAL